MSFLKLRLLLGVILLMPLVACGGGGSPVTVPPASLPAASAGRPAAQAVEVPLGTAAGTFALPLSAGFSGTISVALRNTAAATLGLGESGSATPGVRTLSRAKHHGDDCPAVPLITLRNPSRHAIDIKLVSFTLKLPCDVDGTLFGVSFYQTVPEPATIAPLKLGDATASGHTITFTPAVSDLTLPPKTTSVVAVLPETSTNEIALPVVPGVTTFLTPANAALPSTLSFKYPNASGGTLFSSACSKAFDSNGKLVPALQGVPLVGTPSLYCRLDPADGAITFGGTVNFFIGAPQPDASFLELDGMVSAFACTSGAVAECSTPAFTIPAIKNVIVGNAKDLAVCVPVTLGQDCNNVAGAALPAPAATSVPPNREVHLLVADDPSYAAPNFGGFEVTTPSGSGCLVFHGADQNTDVPANYADPGGPQETPPVYGGGTSTHATYAMLGPFVEFDLMAGASGACTVVLHETTGLLRSNTFTIPIATK